MSEIDFENLSFHLLSRDGEVRRTYEFSQIATRESDRIAGLYIDLGTASRIIFPYLSFQSDIEAALMIFFPQLNAKEASSMWRDRTSISSITVILLNGGMQVAPSQVAQLSPSFNVNLEQIIAQRPPRRKK
jgi:hypothetical protein